MDSSHLLQVVTKVAFSPGPYPQRLQDVARIALEIANITGTKSGKIQKTFGALVNDAYNVVYTRHKVTANVPAELSEYLQNLVQILVSVKALAETVMSRNVCMRLIMNRFDLQKIRQFRAELKNEGHLFSSKSTIAAEGDLVRFEAQQRQMMQAIRERSATHSWSRQEALESDISQKRQETEDLDFSTYRPLHGAEPFMGHQNLQFPDIQLPHGIFSMSLVEGDQKNVDSSRHITNTNSGNITTNVTTNSNNDSSVRARRRVR